MKCLTCKHRENFYSLQNGVYELLALGRCKNEYNRRYVNRVINCYSDRGGKECKFYSGGEVAKGQISINEVIK